MARRVALAAALLVTLACNKQDEESRPPLYVEDPPANLRGCSDLQAVELALIDERVFVDSLPAACAVGGASCPLDPAGLPTDACASSELPFGRCVMHEWQLTCVPLAPAAGGMGGTAGASDDGGAGALGGTESPGGAAGRSP